MELMQGKNFVDDRGMLTFFNDFDFSGVKRMYLVRNHRAGFIRAWHGHKKEAKYVSVLKGAAVVAKLPMGLISLDFVEKVTLSEHDPKILYIPPGFYNGFKTLTDDTIIQFFSTSSMEEAKNDDFREDWNLVGAEMWEENYR